MIFVWSAGIELDREETWSHRRASGITSGRALGVPLLSGCLAAIAIARDPGWAGPNAMSGQFALGIGMSCAVTALPILVPFVRTLAMLRQPIGRRILRYASPDDVAIWGVLALILTEWHLVGRQAASLFAFAVAGAGVRWLLMCIRGCDRWYAC